MTALPATEAATAPPVSLAAIAWRFLIIGATSFGGVVPYLREHLVLRAKWLDEKEFVEFLSISQSLPGLNATNMAILVGQRLRGRLGALVATVAICAPGALIMLIAGIIYRERGDHAATTAALKGVAAAAVGLILSTVVKLSQSALDEWADYVFVALTVAAITWLHQSVLTTLVCVGILSIFWHRPTTAGRKETGK